jgi:hypothetical protein
LYEIVYVPPLHVGKLELVNTTDSQFSVSVLALRYWWPDVTQHCSAHPVLVFHHVLQPPLCQVTCEFAYVQLWETMPCATVMPNGSVQVTVSCSLAEPVGL